MTIKLKLLFFITGTLVAATIAVLIVVNHRFTSIIDENRQALYTERADTILGILRRYDERLQMTGQAEAYYDGFRESAIELLKKTYYRPPAPHIFPLIIDLNDEFVMFPEFFEADFPQVRSVLTRNMRAAGTGSFEFEKRWYLYKRFDNWNWLVAYTVPLNIKYAEVQELLNILISIMTAITALSIIFMWLVIIRITRPVAALTRGARAIAAGDYSCEIDTAGSGEIGRLAKSFIIMRDHITDLLSERDTRIAELESTKKELLAREKSLAQYAQRLSIHVEQTPLGVIEFDLDFRIVQWNKAAEKIFGYTSREASGRHAMDLLVPDSAGDHVAGVWKDIIEKKKSRKSTNENITKDGRIITCEWHNTGLIGPEGDMIGVAALVLDVSEARRLEEKLRQAHKMEAVGTLAGGIAHDFNNILSVILGYAEMLREDIPGHSPEQSHIDHILKAALRAKALVRQILSFSRKEAMARTPLKIHLPVEEAAGLLRASIPATIEIRRNIDPRCGNVLADPTQIHQVVMNLCANAAQSMDENGGCLDIALSPVRLSPEDLGDDPGLKPGPYVRLTVADTGTGIDRKHLDKIFDPYFTTKDVGKGSGMGLAVVIGIVKSHDGMITVDTEPGRGTAFNVYFPQIGECGREKTEDAAPVPEGREKILVVDDEKSIAAMTARILGRLGYHVTAKTDSVEALELFCSRPSEFDLVITDQTMPGLTGADLARKILEIRPEIPIILSTGYSSIIDAEKAELGGISAFVMKPVNKKELAGVIRSVLER